ncbi:hypothetical protein EWM64_g2500 [Hericium alpestre]|uniref:Uncharacterized protein n=1 Tax=Hericium alpestre TaxID=135208 RepID=A0A4Z0A474_9AGAM|nr:hypothetical protein EWM64_g2500 [Hericium alpestre]
MNRLRLRVEVAQDALQAKQKELSRTMIPHVQDRLRKGYDGALLVTARGRQPITALRKRKFYEYLHEHRKTVFLTLVEMLMDGLDEAIDSLESSLPRNTKLAQEVEVSMSALWDGVPQGLDLPQMTARHEFQRVIDAVPRQARLWCAAQKRAAAALSAPEPVAGPSGQN